MHHCRRSVARITKSQQAENLKDKYWQRTTNGKKNAWNRDWTVFNEYLNIRVRPVFSGFYASFEVRAIESWSLFYETLEFVVILRFCDTQ